MKRIKELISKDDLITLINQTHDKLSFVDSNYIYRVVNNAYLTTFNTTADQIIGKYVWEVIGEKTFYEVVKPNIDKALAGEEVYYEAWFDFPSATRAYLIVQYRPVMNETHEITGVTVTATDISEHKKLEEEKSFYETVMLNQSKMAQLGDMIGLIAHQWRGQLHTLSTYILRLRMPSEINREETFNRCEELVEQLSESIDDLYGYYNDDTVSTSILTSVEQAVNLLQHRIRSEKIDVKIDIPKKCIIAYHNTNLLYIFVILIENALDALEKSPITNKTILISGNCHHENIMINIQDNGDGVSTQVIEKLFDKNTSSKSKSGHGYGLFFAHKMITEHMHGTIDLIQSASAAGAHFQIILPKF